jgi:hypothetical protein
MNKIVYGLIISFLVISCSKNDTPATTTEPPPPLDTTVTDVRYMGNFINGPYGTTRGVARIVSTGGKLQLRISEFSVNSGPDLKVYISRERQPLNFIRLGSLRALTGDQLYDITGTPDFSDFRYVLIHCEKFNHLFGSAELMEN